ncbi:unnamed protein product [Arctia plantaginis]|uniref:Uncharacterized protein n=1 Tax=Arctia plantaginis TaxID=874455 RepID=A0A8S1APB5_ARCPL|nr:unnamed protein product [Arctia plantaginis]
MVGHDVINFGAPYKYEKTWDPKRRITSTDASRHEFVIGCALGAAPAGVLALPRLAPPRTTRGALLHSQSAGDVAAMLGRA